MKNYKKLFDIYFFIYHVNENDWILKKIYFFCFSVLSFDTFSENFSKSNSFSSFNLNYSSQLYKTHKKNPKTSSNLYSLGYSICSICFLSYYNVI